ncbi:hypothetical protein SODALDRAFT_328650 [Sodiomyces alkalinus F11]|uniref:Uncharacterized protein n=1 Tax=Sodiomyces alkalinus (strain CBS 110278 / VKM F-3762 / F11) TaxID=1314773 RepID=A0A3N2PLC6_SODAK|nr:hypothetical protein SODALDRAFT_328650 [Sodiomyces alkalinus F11]ROT35328.1 hypothetical protein SODALDRAFT_328650 [Sodiomyces alkalinus F11]
MRFLQRHRLLQHPMLPSAAFYLDPRSDVLCLPNEIEPEHLKEVQKHYGAQLDDIQMILVEELGQWEDTPSLAPLLPIFRGLGTVKVLLESYEFDSGWPDEDDMEAPATEEEYRNAASL